MDTILSELLVESDNDLPFGVSLDAGLGEDHNLILCMERWDLESPKYGYVLYAIVDKDDTLLMANRLGIQVEELPKCLKSRFGTDSGAWVPSRVEALFSELLNFILDCGVRYRLKRV